MLASPTLVVVMFGTTRGIVEKQKDIFENRSTATAND
jgi:hypothetical protein